MLKIGIVGLGQVGKTTLFRALTRAHGAGLGSAKPEAHVGVVHVPDSRLDWLAQLYHPKRTVYASVEYIDTPGSIIELARSGTQAANLREMNALTHVLRTFEDESIAAPGGSINPQRDRENVELELILSDLAATEKRLERLEKDLKKQKSPALEKEYQALQMAKGALEKQRPLREVDFDAEAERAIRGFSFLSSKPMLYVLNVSEKDAAASGAPDHLAAEAGLKPRPRIGLAAICGKVEAELAELSDAEAAEFLASYGLKESAGARLIHSTYQLLGLIAFFTVSENECHSWTVRSGATALEAAGEVHSDFQKKFIRAEVVQFKDLAAAGSLAEARHRGLVKLEGKEYVLHDGEVVYFRHSA